MKLIVPMKIWEEIAYCTELCLPNEVTGAGVVRVLDESTVRVERLFLPKQKVSPGLSTFSETGMHEIVTDLLIEGEGDEEWLRFRWHSHGRGGVYFSSIDEEDISKWPGDWVINMVVNAKGERRARLNAFMGGIRIVDHPVEIVVDVPVDDELWGACAQNVAAKVTTPGVQLPKKLEGGGADGVGLLGSE